MAPVVLQTDVHCFKCARKIRKAIWNLFGVERVWASPATGLVVVAGTADASVLKRRIQRKIRRYVTIISDGTVEPWGMPSHYAGMTTHLAPPQYAPPPPAGYPSSYGWGMAWQQPAGYPYDGNYWASDHHYDHVPNSTPTCSIL